MLGGHAGESRGPAGSPSEESVCEVDPVTSLPEGRDGSAVKGSLVIGGSRDQQGIVELFTTPGFFTYSHPPTPFIAFARLSCAAVPSFEVPGMPPGPF